MKKALINAASYRIEYTHKCVAVYIGEQLLGTIHRSNSVTGWPFHISVNDQLYLLCRKGMLSRIIEISSIVNEARIGVIKMAGIPLLPPHAAFYSENGEESWYWFSGNFFSLHWKWYKKNGILLNEAADNLLHKRNSGILRIEGVSEYTDLLTMMGFFLSLLKRSKLSLGLAGMRNKKISWHLLNRSEK